MAQVFWLLLAVVLIAMAKEALWTPSRDVAKKAVDMWGPLALKYSHFHGVPADVILGVICVESEEDVTNPKLTGDELLGHKSVGLMGLRKPALDDFNAWNGKNYTEADLFTPWVNIEVGTGYLAGIRERYVKSHRLEDAIEAYNDGPGSVGSKPTTRYLYKVLSYRQIIQSMMEGG